MGLGVGAVKLVANTSYGVVAKVVLEYGIVYVQIVKVCIR